MGKIHQLDSHLTNMIAAGEVVERPMGVVKELVENAIDAKASQIDVYIQEGGIASILVKDNGEGMDQADATQAFLRHSTSKIAKEEDLWMISSLGFRGEALPSIASVSECVCITNNGQQATKVTIHYGKFLEAISYDSEKGTQIQISGLFLKTPARLKHLKSIAYEQALIMDVMIRFAMAYPEIAFSLNSDNRILLSTNGNNDEIETLYQIYGQELAQAASHFEGNDQDFKIKGLMVKPHITRATKKDIYIYLNQRMVRSTRIQRAIIDGFKHFIPVDRYPIVFLRVDVDLKLVDVNVHPSKWEVRLSKEKQLLELVTQTINEALRTSPQVKLTRAFSSSQSEQVLEHLVFDIPNQTYEIPNVPASLESDVVSEPKTQTFRVLAQHHRKYILAEHEDGLYIFDQHASMERIRYEYFKKKRLDKTHNQQPLLLPILIPSSSSSLQSQQLKAAFADFQVPIEPFDEQAFVIRSVPQWMSDTDHQKVIDDMLEYFESGIAKDQEDIQKQMLATLACHSSIRFNDYLSMDQMQRLINDLMLCEQPYHCPHGRPTFIKISADDLIKEFLR